MEEIILEAIKREDVGSGRVNRLRKKAIIPCVVYGEGKKAFNIQVLAKDLTNLMAKHRGESFVLKLRIKEGDSHKDKSVLIKETQYNPVTDKIVHVDFIEISLTKTIKVKVPLVAKGDAIGVKLDGGILDHIMWEFEVECLPTEIPKSIDVDVTNLKIGDYVQVKDIKVPQGIKVLHELDATVLHLAPPEKEAAPAAEGAVEGEAKQEPEVIKEKKKEAEEPAAEGKGGKGKEDKK